MSAHHSLVNGILEKLLPHIDRHIQACKTKAKQSPFILGITGLQGSGKSTLASLLTEVLNQRSINTITLSLDDLYHTHETLVGIRKSSAENKLLRVRGQPGTHDQRLAQQFFESLSQREADILVPSFDKSLFGGEGDRVSSESWPRWSQVRDLQVVVFEGWCLGFRPLSQARLQGKVEAARGQTGASTLLDHSLEDLALINANLRQYCDVFMGPDHLNYLVHLDTEDLENVYEWRLEQEHASKRLKGTGMTDNEVVAFVRGYMPAYELYLDSLRQGFFSDTDNPSKKQLHVLMDRGRKTVSVEEL